MGVATEENRHKSIAKYQRLLRNNFVWFHITNSTADARLLIFFTAGFQMHEIYTAEWQ